MARNPTARADAKARGDKYYTTGEPCKNGHMAPRAAVSGSCTECTRVATKAWAAQRPEKAASRPVQNRINATVFPLFN
jgi:hypothetical protein